MSILRLSTLSLALAIGVMTLGYVNSSSAAPKNCDTHPRPACDPDPDPEPPSTITYKAELKGRVFSFAQMNVTPDGDGHTLYPDETGTLTFSRPTGTAACNSASQNSLDEAACAWDAVFAACENFFGPNPIEGIGPTPNVVESFEVAADDWSIQQPGGVRLAMKIAFNRFAISPPGDEGTYFSVSLQLIGNTLFESPNDSFLPVPTAEMGPETIPYPIFDFWITGRTAKGVGPKKGCVSGGSAETVDFDPALDAKNPDDTLRFIEIEATDSTL
jgi:hypothetical protein